MSFWKRLFGGSSKSPQSLTDKTSQSEPQIAKPIAAQPSPAAPAKPTTPVEFAQLAQMLVDRPMGAKPLLPVKVYTEEDLATLDSFEVRLPSGDGRCSDNDCPCPSPGTPIPHGGGFLYIDPATVEFRRQARTNDALKTKGADIQQDFQRRGINIVHDPAVYKAILVCEQGARKRGLNLEVAAEDARLAWTEGRALLRATAKIGS